MIAAAPEAFSAAFAADLHLSAADGEGIARAVALLELCARRTPRLFLLGDVFDLWISGAELQMPEFAPLFAALRTATAGGLRVDFLAGNRDFNFTPEHGAQLGVTVAAHEEIDVDLDGAKLRLLHGDQLLRDDVAYQRLKVVLRSPPLRFLARALPAAVSLSLGRRLRRYSDRAVVRKPTQRMRIVPEAVRERFDSGSRTVLCGHVHRLMRVDFGAGRELIVLPPFFESGRFVVLSGGELREADASGAVRALPDAAPLSRKHSPEPPPKARDCASRASSSNFRRFGMAEDDGRLHLVTIDGPAGVGKSSVARRVAERLGWFHLDTGATYRAVTLLCLKHGFTAERLDEAAVALLLEPLDLEIANGGHVWLDGVDVTAALRSPEVTGLVSPVSALPIVRHKLVELQRRVGAAEAKRSAGVVVEGRDAGSYIFPQARWRFYLDASLAERARRRLRQELGQGEPLPEQLTDSMERLATRDRIDRERAVAPLKVPDGAIVLDTTHLSLDEVVAAITRTVRP